ncbi:uncharacterized protein A1O9_00349 [Exophiala aquamarina CBS 119918]|uniref:gamma-glutamylcyclotransferase n=1 Tax=Exophiala aquamarina CBS 119918 TaxID=1182545 RepID=A0A072PRL2_9EURO|nr:uncharacterized protein A1O9_00349 [Exophiala aquamarina CBS 119918]KEF62377.1 hypothetical protein A1O9_00349 [Exophiala aquamarina CBS 119918]
MATTCPAITRLRQAVDQHLPANNASAITGPTPITTPERRARSLSDLPIEISQLSSKAAEKEPKDTVLYLGYGSNLCAETFQGKRNINPLSQVNVVVPALSLTFDLPGLPYTEPCFGNVRYRDTQMGGDVAGDDYHKDRWHKGLVGVVYEVTRADYINIIATEGGGSGYQDVLVDCFALNGTLNETVPSNPSGPYFKAHTLYDPTGLSRREHSYAQPSPRYLKLITDGATEHALPQEYQDFLNQIRPFHLTTNRQRLGQFIFLSIWGPFILFALQGSKIFLRPDGTYPPWMAKLVQIIFTSTWASYDKFFKRTFGDGERTIGDSDHDQAGDGSDEKAPLLRRDKSLV